MPTKQDVIDAYKYQFGGLVMDAVRNRTGTGSAQAADQAFAAIERGLGEVYDLLVPAKPDPIKAAGPPPPVHSNGTPPTSKPAAGPTGRPPVRM